MKEIRLQLLGVPTLWIDGVQKLVEPRLTFEVLAKVILAGSDGIHRSVLTNELWGHIEEKNRRLQLRTALHRLRLENVRLGLSEMFSLEGEILAAQSGIVVDIQNHQVGGNLDWSELRQYTQSFAAGWDRSHWQRESDEYGELLSAILVQSTRRSWPSPELLAILRLATSNYPTNSITCGLLVGRLRREKLFDEANEVIIHFESAWVDRFGFTDIPSLGEVADDLMQKIVPLDGARKWNSVQYIGSICLCILICVLIWLKKTSAAPKGIALSASIQVDHVEHFRAEGHSDLFPLG